MISELHEFKGGFDIELKPETMEEAILLTRLSLNKTQVVRTYVYAHPDNKMTASVIYQVKRKKVSLINKP